MYEDLIAYFRESPVLDCHCYVADYTEQANQARKRELARSAADVENECGSATKKHAKTGVVISTEPFTDIQYFTLKKTNSNNTPYLAINNEKYSDFISLKDNCECMFHSLSDRNRPWSLYLETKYCKEYNIDDYSLTAFKQMKSMMETLKNKGLMDYEKRRNYFAYSVPEHHMRSPFESWEMTQSETIRDLKEKGVFLLGCNSMLIATATHLLEPKNPI